ncbi:ABC transporter permease family protein [Glycomyces xiaoerkulensis]|uniref:ABC transporter permease n=1 Tax=Glycomyces xiaoerkulensis TaxID=2038139 RepID=UPI000C2696ED|nr:ABC transporter permease [Glycomyces xiaoerkulensis]
MTTVEKKPVRRPGPAWWPLARAETRLIIRNRTALLSAATLPLAFGLALIFFEVGYLVGAPGALAAMQLMFLQLFGVYATGTMTLASRRRQHYLKRLRTSPASTTGIVAGLTVPLVALTGLQTVLVYAAAGAVHGSVPAAPVLLAAAFALASVTMVGFAFLTAAFTSTPEAAQYTIMPGFVLLMIGMSWVQTSEPESLGPLALLVPGGAPTALARAGWDGPADWVGEVVWPVVIGAAVAAAVCWAAARLFRWQPRT